MKKIYRLGMITFVCLLGLTTCGSKSTDSFTQKNNQMM